MSLTCVPPLTQLLVPLHSIAQYAHRLHHARPRPLHPAAPAAASGWAGKRAGRQALISGARDDSQSSVTGQAMLGAEMLAKVQRGWHWQPACYPAPPRAKSCTHTTTRMPPGTCNSNSQCRPAPAALWKKRPPEHSGAAGAGCFRVSGPRLDVSAGQGAHIPHTGAGRACRWVG